VVRTYRTVCLLAGLATAAAAALLPWTDWDEGIGVIGSLRFSNLTVTLLGAAVGAVILVRVAFALRVWWAQSFGARVAVTVIVAGTLGSAGGLWFGYLLPGRLVAFEYRRAVQLALYSMSVWLAAGAAPGDSIRTGWTGLLWRLKRSLPWRRIALMVLITVVGSAGITWFILDAMPHIADGCNYLLQGRMLLTATPAVTTGDFVPLFSKDLYWIQTPRGWVPKGLWGFPALLAAADPVHLAWLVNPILAGVLVWLTWYYVRSRAGEPIAVIAAAVLAFCPWLWCNAATFMPHMAAAVGLLAFLIAFDRLERTGSSWAGLVAGIAIGATILIRFQDVAFFAVPAVVWALILFHRQVRRRTVPLACVILGALPGLIGMLALNWWVMGAGSTNYAGPEQGGEPAAGFVASVVKVLAAGAPPGVVGYAAWLHESWAQLSTHWLSGCFPAAMLIFVGFAFARRDLRRMGLLLACSLSFLLCYGAFVFGGRSWVGPRWYVPLLPAAAFVIASGLVKAARLAGRRRPIARLARGYLATATVAVVMCWLVAFPAQLFWWRQHPPHGVDGRVVRAVRDAGLSGVVVALPPDGLLADGRTPNYKWLRTAAWAMAIPFERSDVIYVHGVRGWRKRVRRLWPDRRLYVISSIPGEFDLIALSSAVPPDPSDTSGGRSDQQ